MDGIRNRIWLIRSTRAYPEDMVAGRDDMPEIEDEDMALISRLTDFLGVNYYNRLRVGRSDGAAAEGERTAMGWLVEPKGLRF